LKPPTHIFSLRYAISRHAYAIASRVVFSAALHSAIDVGGISGIDRDNRDLGSLRGTALERLLSDWKSRLAGLFVEPPTHLNTVGSRSPPSIRGQPSSDA
jgi:hypothetical protein